MGAPERIVHLIQAHGNGPVGQQLAITWPSLAAALADLCYDHEVRPPDSLRRAHQIVAAEDKRLAGD